MLRFLIVLTGIFFYIIPGQSNLTDIPQMAYFVFSAGIIFSMLIIKKSLLASIMLFIVSFSFLRTMLLGLGPMLELMDSMLMAMGLAVIYYSIRCFGTKEDILKWFLVPACLNIGFIFIQAFYPDKILLRGTEVCGFLGNAGLTATFLGMTTPIFIKYFKLGILPLLVAIILCKGLVGLLAFAVSFIIYFWNTKRILAYSLMAVTMMGFSFVAIQNFGQFLLRIVYMVGSADGAMHHPFLGWGMGTFVSVVSKIPSADSYYFGIPFNSPNHMMNHPHNEFIFGWWNFGISFMVCMILYVVMILKSKTRGTAFSVLLCSLCVMMFYFFTPPTFFLTALALGIHENETGGLYGT